jgi:hypothetical protein
MSAVVRRRKRGKEVITMKTTKITKVWIDKVEGIQVVKPTKHDKDFTHPEAYGLAECRILVDCGNDEVFELILNASYAEKLEFKEVEND